MLYNKVLLAALALSTGFVEGALARGRGGQGKGQAAAALGGAQAQQQKGQQNATQSTAGQQAPQASPTQAAQANGNAAVANNAQPSGIADAGGASGLALEADALQTGSEHNGQGAGVSGVKTGQAPAQTDNANFINHCAGKQLTNGAQVKTGSCNGIRKAPC